MINVEKITNIGPYSLNEKEKNDLFNKEINKLTLYHYRKSNDYKKILNLMNYDSNKNVKIDEIPFLPVRLFKNFELKSIKHKEIFKILLSSGTTSNIPSKIFLDKANASTQSKILNKIVKTVLSNERLPMLIIDKDPKNIDRKVFNAKMAAIYGFAIFGTDHTYILNEDSNINYEKLNAFLEKYANQKFFVFGFTSMIYQHLILKLLSKNIKSNFKNGILLHGGGWKKLENIKISNVEFKRKLFEKTKLLNIFNYYGLVEQTGSIFLECKCGYFITSTYSDILIRDKNFKIIKNGKKGLIQLLSLLPTSYPGHSILTEDIGQIVERKKCKCDINGKRFLVHGRVESAEVRGCSDV